MSFCGSVQTNTSSICQSKVWPFGLDGVHMDVINLLFWFSLEMKNEIVIKGPFIKKVSRWISVFYNFVQEELP